MTPVAALTKGATTRRAVLDAATDLFGRDGYRATSVAHIARQADVGGSVPYAYFASKEDLFLSALDGDASGIIEEGLSIVFDDTTHGLWRQQLMLGLVAAVDRHPLAKRVLAGLEPDVTDRVMDIPALLDLRVAVGERLAREQRAGTVRSDIDAAEVGSGMVSIILSLLMSVVQLGEGVSAAYSGAVIAVLKVAIDPVGGDGSG